MFDIWFADIRMQCLLRRRSSRTFDCSRKTKKTTMIFSIVSTLPSSISIFSSSWRVSLPKFSGHTMPPSPFSSSLTSWQMLQTMLQPKCFLTIEQIEKWQFYVTIRYITFLFMIFFVVYFPKGNQSQSDNLKWNMPRKLFSRSWFM